MRTTNYDKIVFFSICLFIWSCRASQKNFYSYNVEKFIYKAKAGESDPVKTLFNFSSILSCGDYLFEYKITTHINKENHGYQRVVVTKYYDTSGVYLISAKTRQYYEFDNFSADGKLLKAGPVSDKERGMDISPVTKNDSSDTYYGPLQEVILNNVTCYSSEILDKKSAQKDAVQSKVIMVKKENFNSLFKVKGIEFTDNAYCIFGFGQTAADKSEYFSDEINNLRLLTTKEISICQSLIKKAEGK